MLHGILRYLGPTIWTKLNSYIRTKAPLIIVSSGNKQITIPRRGNVESHDFFKSIPILELQFYFIVEFESWKRKIILKDR